jgi:hypothetical protein
MKAKTLISRPSMLVVLLTVAGTSTALAQTGNTAYGNGALTSNSGGNDDSAFGENALNLNTSGWDNTAVGWSALQANTNGGENTAIGYQALVSNTSGGGLRVVTLTGTGT